MDAAARDNRGFTLIEVIVAVVIGAIMVGVYTAVLSSTFYLRRTQYDVQAASVIQEALDSLRTLPHGELVNRTNGRLLAVSIPRGDWQVTASASAASAPNVLSLPAAQTAVLNETGVAILPGNYRDAATFAASVKALAASPLGWGAGIAVRYRDAENHYRLRFSSGGIAFDKVYQGTVTTLWTQNGTYNKDTWYALEVVAADDDFTLKKNGATLATVTDAAIAEGDLAVMSLAGALVEADSLAVTENSATTTWNFDADAVGDPPEEWRRLSALDLPSGGATLTIQSFAGDANIKQATVNVTWQDGTATRNASGSSFYVKNY